MLQILTNLLLNAIGVAPRTSAVAIEGSIDGAGRLVIVVVSDEGPGIAPERRATLLSAGVSTRPGGAGIGLRHAAALARRAGGVLSLADSDSGARFELRWPYHKAGSRAPSSSERALPVALSGAAHRAN